ncbi:MAG: M28 family metallopeptidase [Bacteroidetes bacterium]|nr:M28 family metallopeptidase [Bacteroidota bacterium]
MLLLRISFLIIFLFEGNFCKAQSLDPVAAFPLEFGEKAMVHVKNICAFGERGDGTEAAKKTVDYIGNEFTKAGLEIEKDTFSYSAFEAKKIALAIDGKKIIAKQIILNPYKGNIRYKGSFLFFYPDSSLSRQMMQNMRGKIIVTKDPADYYSLSNRSPWVIIVLDKPDFDRVVRSKIPAGSHEINFNFSGKIRILQSVNVVGILKPTQPDSGEIILSAHWDSYNSAGADDNASGVATLIELARYFSLHKTELKTTLKFVSFGAEEKGTIGAVAYVDHHRNELKNCKLMFNIDGVSGLRDIYVDLTGKVENISPEKGVIREKLYFRNMALRGKPGNWFWIEEYPMASDVPKWLWLDVIDVCNAFNTKINQVSGIGSDHQAFALAGIPCTSITIDNGIETHTSADTPEKVHPEGMWIAGRIVAGVVAKIAKSEIAK